MMLSSNLFRFNYGSLTLLLLAMGSLKCFSIHAAFIPPSRTQSICTRYFNSYRLNGVKPFFQSILLRRFLSDGSDDENEMEDRKTNTDETLSSSRSSKLFFDDMTRELFGDHITADNTAQNPFASNLKRLNKGNLYDDEELMKVLNVHRQFADVIKDDLDDRSGSDEGESVLSLHDLVMQSIGEQQQPLQPLSLVEDVGTEQRVNGVNGIGKTFMSRSFPIDDEMKTRIANVRAIASDVDGTILSTRQTIHPRTRQAIIKAVDLASTPKMNGDRGLDFFFPATGKSRKGALDSLGIEIGTLIAQRNCPGVYLQGLYCVDGNGNVLFEKKLTAEAVAAAENLAREHSISIVAYDGDDLYTTKVTDIVTHLHEHYGEPMPKLLPSSDGTVMDLAQHETCMHKLLLMDNDTDKLTNVFRPKLEALAERYGACVTLAIPTMLEWLPAGCSKALGVRKVCSALGIDPTTELLALGDAENDAEMLQMASIGVAMGNGCPHAKEAADFVMEETNNDGGAGAAMELFGFGRGNVH